MDETTTELNENLDQKVREVPEPTDLDETVIDLDEMEIKDLPEPTDLVRIENPGNQENPENLENLDNPEMMLLSIELRREETERRENMDNSFEIKLVKRELPEREFTIANLELEEERKLREVVVVLETGVLRMVMENGTRNPSLKTLPRSKEKPQLKEKPLPPFLKRPKNKRRPERRKRRESRKKKRRKPS